MDRVERTAYFAGFFDGEGNVRIMTQKPGKGHRKHHGFQMRMTITNTNLEVLRDIKKHFRCGSIQSRRSLSNRHKKIYVWNCCSIGARGVLTTFLPYLICKKKQAEIAIKFQKIASNRNYRERPDEITDLFFNLKEQMHKLNLNNGGWKDDSGRVIQTDRKSS